MATSNDYGTADQTEKALSLNATDINTQQSTNSPRSDDNDKSEKTQLSDVANQVDTNIEAAEEEIKTTTNIDEEKEEKKEDIALTYSPPPSKVGIENAMLSTAQTVYNSPEAQKYHIQGSFKSHWADYVNQPFVTAKVKTHEGKEEVINFANPLAPRRIYVGLKIKRISDIDNVRETYRCRFHMYFDWLLTKEGYESYVEYTSNRKNKKLEWYPPFRPRYEFLNIVEAHMFEEVDYGIEGPYRVQRIKDFAKDLVGFDPEHAFMCRMRLEVDATFCEELELENFPVDCQDFSVVMREGWGTKRAIFVPELRTKKGKPSDFARVDPSFSVLDEWEFHNSRIEFRSSDPRESRSDTEYFMLTIRFKMRRRYSVYMWNIVLYMFFIALLSLSCFALSNTDIVGERMSLAVTLLLTAVAFQDIVFEELPNVAYLTLLHKYIIVSFVFIAGVAIQSAMTAISFVNWFSDPNSPFDFPISAVTFFCVFIIYNVYFLVKAGWLRHWESKKLYMDSEQLEEYVEESKHQFKMKWKRTAEQTDFRGKNGRIASFVDTDPLLEIKNTDTAMANSFCKFACLMLRDGLCAAITCQCCSCQTKSDKRTKANALRTVISSAQISIPDEKYKEL